MKTLFILASTLTVYLMYLLNLFLILTDILMQSGVSASSFSDYSQPPPRTLFPTRLLLVLKVTLQITLRLTLEGSSDMQFVL